MGPVRQNPIPMGGEGGPKLMKLTAAFDKSVCIPVARHFSALPPASISFMSKLTVQQDDHDDT